MIYADYNATTPCLPEIAEVMTRYLCEDFVNPSNRASLSGRRARGAIDTAREQLAKAIGATPDELVFTSGSTEAANMIILGVMQRLMNERPRIISSAIEHPSVCMPAEYCGTAGADWVELPVDPQGVVDLEALKTLLEVPTALVCVMGANNETGVVQPMSDTVRLCHQAGALVFSDYTQMLGKLPFNVHTDQLDFACFSAHKCYGPKGVGAMYKRRGLSLPPLIRGGGQEDGMRSGTENVPGIVGFGMAADLAGREIHSRKAHLQRLSSILEGLLRSQIPGLVVQSGNAPRIPGTSMLSVNGLKGNWLAQLSDIAASSGSACASLQGKPSHVLLSMGVSAELAKNSIRISLGKPTTEADVRHIARRLIEGAAKLS
jgi:cysteine desulfurase